MTILLNGSEAQLHEGATLADVLVGLGVSVERRGVAVAVDGEVVPRAQWSSFALAERARVEVLSAMQGG